MSLGSEHNVKSLYVEQLPFEQPHKALGGEKSCTINNCISTLSRSLTAPPCPGDRHSPSHRSELRALRELITSGQGQARCHSSPQTPPCRDLSTHPSASPRVCRGGEAGGLAPGGDHTQSHAQTQSPQPGWDRAAERDGGPSSGGRHNSQLFPVIQINRNLHNLQIVCVQGLFCSHFLKTHVYS